MNSTTANRLEDSCLPAGVQGAFECLTDMQFAGQFFTAMQAAQFFGALPDDTEPLARLRSHERATTHADVRGVRAGRGDDPFSDWQLQLDIESGTTIAQSCRQLELCQRLILELSGKRCRTPKAGTALRVLRTFGVRHLFPLSRCTLIVRFDKGLVRIQRI